MRCNDAESRRFEGIADDGLILYTEVNGTFESRIMNGYSLTRLARISTTGGVGIRYLGCRPK